jgi:hypothetical protein
MRSHSNIVVKNSLFEENMSLGEGSIVRATNNNASILIVNSIFYSNRASYGGVVFVRNKNMI